MTRPFSDRREAGRALGARLATMRLMPPLRVLALPRGGVPVAVEVARALHAPLDLLLVRKIGTPWQPELALAAVVEGDPPQIVVDDEVRRSVGEGADAYIERQAKVELAEIARRRQAWLHGRPPADVAGRTVVVVDDGVATGTTMRAALQALRLRGPAKLVLAVPVAPRETLQRLAAEVDELVCLATPSPFRAVGEHYLSFPQLDDDEVLAALDDAAEPR
jgi:putative phosphoribosyl transferase